MDRETAAAAAMWQPGQILCQKGQFILTVPIVRNKMAIGLGINTDAKIFEICYEIFLNFKFNKLDEEEKNWRDPLFCS